MKNLLLTVSLIASSMALSANTQGGGDIGYKSKIKGGGDIGQKLKIANSKTKI